MDKVADIRVDLADVAPDEFARALGPELGVIWRRDGILEEQVSTEHDVEFCFRYDPGDERRPAVLCLAGDDDSLEVATVVALDRGVEFGDEESRGIVENFYDEVVAPALEEGEIRTKLLVPG